MTNTIFFIKSIVSILSLAFIPLWLEWSKTHFFLLVLLTLGAVISLVLIYNSSNKKVYCDGDMIAIFMGHYLSLVETTIAHSAFNDTFLSINIIIGLAMIILNLFHNKKDMSIIDRIMYMWRNWKIIFIFALVILIINMVLYLLSLAIIIDTSSITSFLYTVFAKVIMIKFILTFIIYSITREFKLDDLSLSLSTVVFVVLFGSFNCYCVIPFVKLNLPLALIHINNIGKHICLLFENSSVKGDSISLKQGVKNIVTTLPILGRYLGEGIDILSKHTRHNIVSPFKQVNSNVIRLEKPIIPLTSVSRFTTISMPKIRNNIEVSYLYNGSISDLNILLKNNIIFFKGIISNLVSNCSNITCKIHLRCSDQVVSINTHFKDGHFEEFHLSKTDLNFVNNKVNTKEGNHIDFLNSNLNKGYPKNLFDTYNKNNRDKFYDCSDDRTQEILRLTNPGKYDDYLDVFMQRDISNNGYIFEKGESSTHTEKPYSTNRGIKRSIDNQKDYVDESTYIDNKYNSISTDIINNEGKSYLVLDFDQEKLKTDPDYLYEICIIARQFLFNHYKKSIEDPIELRNLVDNYKLMDICFLEKINGGYEDIHKAFIKHHKDFMDLNGLSQDIIEICPFSKLYIEGNLDYSDVNLSDDDFPDDNISCSNLSADNLPNSNVEYSPSPEDFKKVVQNFFENFKPEDVHNLIDKLEMKERDCLNNRIGNDSKPCYLKDIDIVVEYESVIEKARENPLNDINRMLTRLFNIKPDLFASIKNKRVFSYTSVSQICSGLNKLLIAQKSFNHSLTEEDYIILTNGLKTRVQTLFDNRLSKDIKSQSCLLKDLNITRYRERVLDVVEGDKISNEFTQLLDVLMIQKPKYFPAHCKNGSMSQTSAKTLYCSIRDDIRKPLTKNEIIYIIDGLESRINNGSKNKTSPNDPLNCKLKDLFYTHNDFILERVSELETCEFTRLLENIIKEKEKIVPVTLKKLFTVKVTTFLDALKKL